MKWILTLTALLFSMPAWAERPDVEFSASQCRVLRQMRVDTRAICDKYYPARSRAAARSNASQGQRSASASDSAGGAGPSGPSGGSASPGNPGSSGSPSSPGDPGSPGSGGGARPGDPFNPPPSKPPPSLPGKPQPPQLPGKIQPGQIRNIIKRLGELGQLPGQQPQPRAAGRNAR
jgi:hypothetical protein